MGTNTLPTRANGQFMDETWFDKINEALFGDLVPRNASGVATNNAGALGTVTYTWSQGVTYSAWYRALNNSNVIRVKSPDSLASSYDLILPESLPASKLNLFLDENGQLVAEGATQAISSSSGNFSNSSGDFVPVTNFSVNLDVPGGRDVEIFVIPDGNTSNSAAVGGEVADTLFRVMRDSTEVGRIKFDHFFSSEAVRYAPGVLTWLDIEPAAGNYDYSLEVLGSSANAYVQYCKMVARLAF
jgi:hypothetical protein